MRRVTLIALIVAVILLFMIWFSNANADLTKPGAFNKSGPLPWEQTFGKSVTLSWEQSQGAEGYQYCLDTKWEDTKCNSSWVDVGNTTDVTVSDFLFTSIYAWTVRAYKGPFKTLSDYGDWWLFYINTSILPAPTAYPPPTEVPAPTQAPLPTPITTTTPPPYPPPTEIPAPTDASTPTPVTTTTSPPYP